MSALMKSLGLDRLTPDERVLLAHELWDSVEQGGPGSYLTDAKRAELAARLAHLEAHPDDVVPWDRVEAAALARFEK
jgi:putative addiction module component (TIGR02574 family)